MIEFLREKQVTSVSYDVFIQNFSIVKTAARDNLFLPVQVSGQSNICIKLNYKQINIKGACLSIITYTNKPE